MQNNKDESIAMKALCKDCYTQSHDFSKCKYFHDPRTVWQHVYDCKLKPFVRNARTEESMLQDINSASPDEETNGKLKQKFKAKGIVKVNEKIYLVPKTPEIRIPEIFDNEELQRNDMSQNSVILVTSMLFLYYRSKDIIEIDFGGLKFYFRYSNNNHLFEDPEQDNINDDDSEEGSIKVGSDIDEDSDHDETKDERKDEVVAVQLLNSIVSMITPPKFTHIFIIRDQKAVSRLCTRSAYPNQKQNTTAFWGSIKNIEDGVVSPVVSEFRRWNAKDLVLRVHIPFESTRNLGIANNTLNESLIDIQPGVSVLFIGEFVGKHHSNQHEYTYCFSKI
jgi:hypothetical protein